MTNEEAKKELEALLNMCDPRPFAKELEDSLNMAIKALEKLPKKGKWILFRFEPTDIFKCSECGMMVVNPYNYCPNCGSYNGGGEDEET